MLKSVPTGPVTIRDPLGRETGHLLLDTNAPVQHLRNLDEQGQPAPAQNGNR